MTEKICSHAGDEPVNVWLPKTITLLCYYHQILYQHDHQGLLVESRGSCSGMLTRPANSEVKAEYLSIPRNHTQ